MHSISFAKRTEDAPCDQASDLYQSEFSTIHQSKGDRVPLIRIAGFIQAGIEEGTMPVSDSRNGSLGGDAVHMNVQNRQKD
jgi:hypothetical protein